MALTIKHTKVSAVPDGSDPSLVLPSDWNADHALTGVATIAQGGTGQATANAAANALLPAQTGNAGKVLGTDGTNTSWVANGGGGSGVTQITAGTNITIDPPSGVGNVTINATGGGSLSGQTQSVSPFETSLGFEAGNANTGVNNTYMGFQAGKLMTGATNNVVVGYQALDACTIPSSNVVVGSSACGATANISQCVVIGYNAAGTTTALGADCVIIGNDAGRTVTGTSNILIGSSCGNNVTTTTGAVGIGTGCFGAMTSAAGSPVAIGNNALGALTTGAGNIAVGGSAGDAITTGANNTLMGFNSGTTLIAATDNTFIGFQTGTLATSNNNTAVGSSAGGALTTGGGNTLIGKGAGSVITTGSNNTLIGTYAGDANGMSNNFIASDGAGNRKIQVSDVGAFAVNGGGYGVAGAYLQSNGVGAAAAWVYPNILGFQTLTTTTLIAPSDKDVYFANATAASFTITLPSASAYPGLCFYIKRTDTSANNLDIASSGGLIEGSPSATQGPGVSVQYISDGNNWWELANG